MTDRKRWEAVISFNTEFGVSVVTHQFDEFDELEGAIEAGPHWEAIASIVVHNISRHESSPLTIERSETL